MERREFEFFKKVMNGKNPESENKQQDISRPEDVARGLDTDDRAFLGIENNDYARKEVEKSEEVIENEFHEQRASMEHENEEKHIPDEEELQRIINSDARPYEPVDFGKRVSETKEVIKKADDRRRIREDRHMVGEENNIFLNCVLDGTYSFSKVFPAVYNVLNKVVHELHLQEKDVRNRKVVFHYGLTWFDGKNAHSVTYEEGSMFTIDPNRFLESVRSLVFRGGNVDGYENVNMGIQKAILALKAESNEGDNRGLLVFTDSKPKEDEKKPSFRDDFEFEEKGLRFVVTCTYDDDYWPSFHIVDSKGISKEQCQRILTISEICGENGVENVTDIITDITNKTSIMA